MNEIPVDHIIDLLHKGLVEMSKYDDECIYPDCDNCGECYFAEALHVAEKFRFSSKEDNHD